MGKRGNPNWTKGVSGNPRGKKRERRDGWINDASGHGTARDRRILTQYGVDIVTDLEAKLLWRSEWIARRIIEVMPGEANRRGWDLKVKDEKLAKKVADRAEELDVDGKMTLAAQYERAYGGGAIYGVFDGALGDASTPLDESKIARVRALHILEPQELTPSAYYGDINHPKFGQPERYRVMPLTSGRLGRVMTVEVHESRMVIFPGRKVSRQTQPGQREGWGDGELNHARAAIADAGLTWGSVATLLHEFGMLVLGIKNLGEMMVERDGTTALAKRMDAIDLFKSTMRALPVDAEDTIDRIQTPLAGLDKVLEQQREWIGGVADMPVSVLFGQQHGGLQSTGAAEIRNWYAKVEKEDKTRYAPRREQLVRWLVIEQAGKEPEEWSIEPRPLWSPSEKEQAETFKLYADGDAKNIEFGVYSGDDAAKSRYTGDGFGTTIKIDWKAREEQKRVEEEMAREQQAATVAALKNPPSAPGEPSAEDAPIVEQKADE